MTSNTDNQVQPAGAAPVDAGQRLQALLLSERFRQSVRVALAMVLAYYIGLSMGWEKPHWAGLAVALCSLGTVGASLRKGLLRINGTFLAGAVALLLLALLPQDRWPYLFVTTTFAAFCTYMMGHSSRWYFWSIAGYVMPLLALASGAEGASAFETVILRLQQTTLGVVVFTVVSVLLWPQHLAPKLRNTISELTELQRRLLAHHFGVLAGQPGDSGESTDRARVCAAIAGLPTIVDGAEVDSVEVWETRHLWRRCAADFAALNESVERWRLGFPELQQLDLQRLIPGLQALGAELDARLSSMTGMLAGKLPQAQPRDIVFAIDESALDSLTRFDRAALVLARDRLQKIEQLTGALFDTLANLGGFAESASNELATRAATRPWTIDRDRLASAVSTFVAIWAILLGCIYVPGLPMPAGIIPTVAAVSINLAMMPQVPVIKLVLPIVGSAAFAGAFYVFLMPQLHNFAGLGLGLFAAVFLVCFMFSRPEQGIARSLALSTFVMVILVSNQQTYSFVYVMNFTLMWLLALGIIWVASWFPISFMPQRVIFKQLHRFLKSCDQLLVPPRPHLIEQLELMRREYHIHEVTTLPAKIGRWMAAVPDAAKLAGGDDRIPALVNSLQVTADRMRELAEVRRMPQSELMVRGLHDGVQEWRRGIQEVLSRLAVDPASMDSAALRSQLQAMLEALEARIESTLNSASQGSISSAEGDNAYRLLGAYRGVSGALINVASSAGAISWSGLREARF
ncbi:MAG TPA: FUSC family protein [Accumulibacter sp.]|uniref:FUSC family protein n=1 Tax=Accumulibacter sp. TaxID=2053492 RepID=UPI002BD5C0DD|nr:FUSC family protein [Accumulibacter sp.]HRD89882.1 FUSC family protein [Accumulibacter sp.]